MGPEWVADPTSRPPGCWPAIRGDYLPIIGAISPPPARRGRRSPSGSSPIGLTHCVRYRKRRGWEAFYRQRNALLLDLLERFGGLDLGGLRRTATIWPSVLPSDLDGAVRNAARLVAGGIHSRRTAVAALGGDDPAGEFARVVKEMRELTSIAESQSSAASGQAAVGSEAVP